MNFWKKKIKDTTSIANKLGVDEEKIKELKEGKRSVSGKTMDKVLEVVNENKIEKQMENVEIWNWYNNITSNDLCKLRLDFGYHTQRELGEKLNESTSSINQFENKKLKKVNKTIKKAYYFFNDEFNKKVESNENVKTKVDRNSRTNKENNDIYVWYKNTDVKKLRKELGYKSIYDFADVLGLSETTISEIETKKMKRVCDSIIKVYNFLNSKKVNESINETTINPNLIVEAEDINDIDVENNEDEQKIEFTEKDTITMLEIENKHLHNKIETLEKQIKRYEKLIDML